MAAVRIDDKAFADARFALLAKLMRLAEPDFAIIKVARIWQIQTEGYTPQRPTYVVKPEVVEAMLGAGAIGHLVMADLAEVTDEGVYMRGTKGRIEWMYKMRADASAGGVARSANAPRVGGKFTSGQPAVAGEGDQRSSSDRSSGQPAETSPLTLTLSLSPDLSEKETAAAAPPPARKKRKEPGGDHAAAMAAYVAGYERKYGVKPDVVGGRDGSIISELLKNHGLEVLHRKLAVAFEQTPEWPPDPWDLTQIKQFWNKLVPRTTAQLAIIAPVRRIEDHTELARKRMAEYEARQLEAQAVMP